MDISHNGSIAASSSLDAHIRLWDLESGKQIKSMDAGPGEWGPEGKTNMLWWDGVLFSLLYICVCARVRAYVCGCVLKEASVNVMSTSISDARLPSAVGPCQILEDFFI